MALTTDSKKARDARDARESHDRSRASRAFSNSEGPLRTWRQVADELNRREGTSWHPRTIEREGRAAVKKPRACRLLNPE